MNFTFQFGDFYGSATTFSLKDFLTILSPIITLGLFWWKLWYDKDKEERAKKTDRLYKLEYFNSLIENTVITATKQSENLEKYYLDINDDDYDIKPLPNEIDTDLLRIVEFNQHSEYYRAYCDYFEPNKTTSKKYNLIFKYITFLYKTNNIINEDLNLSFVKINNNFEKYLKINLSINHKLTNLRNTEYNLKYKNNKIVEIFDELLDEKFNEQPFDLKNYEKKRQDVLFNYLQDELKHLDNDNFIKNSVSETGIIYRDLKMEVQLIKERLRIVAAIYKETTIELEKLFKELNSKLNGIPNK